MQKTNEFDAVVIGSGFGGAVTACRLAQAGVSVCILERGRRYEANDFPTFPFESRRLKREESDRPLDDYEPPRDFSRWLWPVDQGLWDIRDLGRIKAALAAGYGGGSLVYASVHLRAPAEVFTGQEGADGDSARLPWPAAYRRELLDDYYNLAAFMLDVQTFPQDRHDLAKTQRLKEAGEQNWFLPPLAVNFSADPRKPRSVRAQRQQGECDLRGFCCMGCGASAKNTLDLNYLAVAENPTLCLAEKPEQRRSIGAQPKRAHVITLAEVTKIERPDHAQEFPFTVTYRDHLLGDELPMTVQARTVFLCAGALNTTELLFANWDNLKTGVGKPQWLGHGYFPNGDGLATVFDCRQPHEVDRGPTITSSLVYKIEDNWFLVQDGGVPADLDSVLGVFRSPLWLERNCFREDGAETEDEAKRKRDTRPPGLRSYRQLRPTGARELVAMLPPHVTESVQGTVVLQYPDWLKNALKTGGERVLRRFAVAAEPAAQQSLDELALYLQHRLDELANVLPNGQDMLKKAADLGLARGLLRLGAQLLWGSESDAVRRAVEALLRRAPGNLDEAAKSFMAVLRWCTDFRSGDGRTGLLLVMGRDTQSATLRYDAQDEVQPLKLEDDDSHAAPREPGSPEPLRATQERVLRDIATKWDGELRTNPLWTLGRNDITVHGQGGCRMGDSPQVGVTDPDGQVFGCEGLYVMDAAAFPSPVGVNPSATIVAVAEHKIESFIRNKVASGAGWRAPEWAEAQSWGNDHDVKRMLDPIAGVAATAVAQSKAIGLKFQEHMRGYYSSVDTKVGWVSELRADVKEQTSGLSRGDLPKWLKRFTRAELKGIRLAHKATDADGLDSAGEIAVELCATIDDLSAFLDSEYARDPTGPATPVTLTGVVRLRADARHDVEGNICEKPDEHNVEGGTLELFRTATGHPCRKVLEYTLPFTHQGKKYRLHGLKVLEHDSRLDAWQDTTTLSFDIEEIETKLKKWRGVLRLPAADFLERQVKSFEITGTSDRDRQVWALAAFLTFFLGKLADVYLPKLKRLPPLLRNVLRMSGSR